MRPIDDILRQRFALAIANAFGPENMGDPLIKSGDPKFADYQSNAAMALAKSLNGKPREVAAQIIAHLNLDDLCETPTIAGPGFINLRLKKSFLASALQQAFAQSASPRAGVDKTSAPQTVVIDYSGPNIAKAMHVGHLRTTVIGDCFVRTLEFLGHTVVRQNHLGDFGTQFGMLIAYLRANHLTTAPLTLADLGTYYKEASTQFKTDPAFANAARQAVVELQSGAPEAFGLWRRMKDEGRKHYTEIYRLLSITLTQADERGESFYGPRLVPMIERLKTALEFGGEGPYLSSHAGTADDTFDEPIGHEPHGADDLLPETQDANHRLQDADQSEVVKKPFAAYSDGAMCVFLPGYLTRQKTPFPLMIQKSDGGFGYAATDLAAIYFRIQDEKLTLAEQTPLARDWHADRIIITTDSRQKQHLAMVFDTARAAKWDLNPATGQHTSLEHAPSGSILGEDNKPFKTRSGDSVALLDLLHEAIERAAAVKAEKGAQLPPEKRAAVNHAVGIGAVKYADLRQDRTTDYIFAWDRMLSLQGNTGPYLQMQYTRIASIYRKANLTPEQVAAQNPALILDHEDEAALAKKLLQFGAVVESVARDLKPHYLCTYLYELAETFSRFFTNCPVLKAESEPLKLSRLALAHMVSAVLKIGLQDLLGIQVLEEM